ncbi:hypothetical protein BKA56DRAFT_480126 [Ilyonectria sp. MPI-CAGE-AT-0026]|nr:hypothetical protein BKA56DRAFT_480126 [Ilyonectria sp. MPI-CAGE-AT-0026]
MEDHPLNLKVTPTAKIGLPKHPIEEEDSDDSTTESLDDDLSLNSDEDLNDNKRKKILRDKKKAILEAEKLFTRKDGIVYVADDDWVRTSHSAVNCHIFVSSASSILKGTEKPLAGLDVLKEKHSTRSTNPSSKQRVLNATAGKGVARVSLPGELPFRFRIINELLNEKMAGVIGIADLNHDHVAPFRSIIPFEHDFRNLLKEQEDEFADIAAKVPDHPAVGRKKQFLPTSLAYSLETPGRTMAKDGIDRARILLDGLRALVKFLDTDLQDVVRSYRGLELGRLDSSIPKLPFSYLWYLFKPGQEIVTKHPKRQVYRVLQVCGGRKSLVPRANSKRPFQRTVSDLVIDCFYLDFDGKEFGPMPHTISIRPYDDLLPVSNLQVYPLIYEEEPIKTSLIARGKKFEELAHVSHRRYKGLSLKEDDLFDRLEEIDSDVMIDFDLAFRNSEPRIPLPEFGGGIIVSPTSEDDEETNERPKVDPVFDRLWYDDAEYFKSRWSQFTHNTDLLQTHLPGALTESRHLLLPPRVYGYVLLSRKWYPLDINLVKMVPKLEAGEKDGFEMLVLPPGHKDIVRALVRTHARQIAADGTTEVKQSQREFDVVKGKGRGLIILLHGAPGVGKTSTAECVAANAGKPLLPITCGDLGGNTAQEVENNLEKFFDLARKWNCVLLLDEADVFLSAREKGDIRQNSLRFAASCLFANSLLVFLRVLEYYSGILILTTNRVGSFDEAIKSRVHCALYYPPLDEDQTFQIWTMNLDALEDRNKKSDGKFRVRFDRKEIEEYSRRHWKKKKGGSRWNGRQIKNAFQTAVALADWDNLKYSGDDGHPDGPLLERRHFETVATASDHFDKYLGKVRGGDDERAKGSEVRRDDITNDLDDEPGSTKKKPKNKRSSKNKIKPKSPEPSDDSSSEESSSESDSSTSGSGNETEDAVPKEPPAPPPEVPRKKSRKKKHRKE